MKKIVKLIVGMFILCMSISLCSCENQNNSKDEKAYVSIDINPAIELIVDQENKVVSVRGENEDGQVLLYEETGIVGVDINAAIEKITDLAVELGYLDENNKVVDTLVSSENQEFASQILQKVNTSITATASNLGLNVTTDGEGAYSLVRQMNAFKEKFPNNPAIQNMSIQKFKLAVSANEVDGISIEAAIELNDEELISMIQSAHERIESFATDAYREAKEKALALYDEATSIAEYAVYTKFYLDKLLTHPMTAYYGGVYQMYASAAKSFEILYKIASLNSKVSEYPLNQEQVQEIMNILGMTENEFELLKNSNGDITIHSIEEYVDKIFKNTVASERLEETKEKLSIALSEVEQNIEKTVNELSEEYRPQINDAIEYAKQMVTTMETMLAGLPEGIKTIMSNCIQDFKDIIKAIETTLAGEVHLEDINEFSTQLNLKAKYYLDKITADLSDEELSELEALKEEAVQKLSNQKKELEKALDEAEQQARMILSSLKESRKKRS